MAFLVCLLGGSVGCQLVDNTIRGRIQTPGGPAPTVLTVSAANPDGYFKAGDSVEITVEFSEPVQVLGGTPSLVLATGGAGVSADYSAGSGAAILRFNYTVGAGHFSADLDYASEIALEKNGALIRSLRGVDAVVTLPNPGDTGSLALTKDLYIDGIPPVEPASIASDSWVLGLTATPVLTFPNGADSETGVDKHQVRVVKISDSSELVGWTDHLSGTALTGLMLADDVSYRVEVRTVDRAGNPSVPRLGGTWSAHSLQVQPAFPLTGAQWNDYVENNEAKTYLANDTPCDLDNTIDGGSRNGELRNFYDVCLHGGEFRKVLVPGATSCGSLNLTETLGIFVWVCDDSSGTATFYSKGIKPGKGLRDLVNATSWRSNKVSINGMSGLTFYSVSSPLTTWWNNPVVPLPDNSGPSSANLNIDGTDDDGGLAGDGSDESYSPGTIFTLSADRDTHGYTIRLPKIAIVTLGNAALRHKVGAANNCTWNSAFVGTRDRLCLLWYSDQAHPWIEGNYDGNFQGTLANAQRNILLSNSSFWRIRNVTSKNAGNQIDATQGYGLRFSSAPNGYLDGFAAIDNINGLAIWSSSDYNRFNRIKISAVNRLAAYAIHINSNGNSFYDVDLQKTDQGIILANLPQGNTFVKLKIGNMVDGAMKFLSPAPSSTTIVGALIHASASLTGGVIDVIGNNHIFSHVSLIQNQQRAFTLNTASQGAYNQILVARTGYDASSRSLYLDNSAMNTFSQTALGHSYDYEIEIAPNLSDNNIFTRNLIAGNPGNKICLKGAGTVGNNISTGVDCGGDDVANQLKVRSINLEGSFLDSFVTSDPAHPDNLLIQAGLGKVNIANVTDWLSFSSFYRGWAESFTPGFWTLADGNVGACDELEDCGLRDYRLKQTATVVRNTSYDGLNPNAPFTPVATCPAAVHGDFAISKAGKTFLLNAMEIMEDEMGNDNGLCESGEACVYSPNFGAYQGEGDPLSQGSCLFENGSLVVDVEMYAYPINGI